MARKIKIPNEHLEGFHHIGIYPILQDNTTWFLAADFDKANWQDEAVALLSACKEKEIPAYLERSRSGNGGHVLLHGLITVISLL